MIEVAYHPVPDNVHRTLEVMPNESRQRVVQGIQRLHLVENGQGSFAEHEDSSHVFATDSEVVSAHMGSIAQDVSQIYSADPERVDGAADSEELWSSILDHQLSAAKAASERGDKETAVHKLIDYLITTELSLPITRGGTRDNLFMESRKQSSEESLDRIVASGLSRLLVDAARQSYGLVYLEPETLKQVPHFDSKVVSIAHTISAVVPQVEVSVGRSISVDPEDAPLGNSLDKRGVDSRIKGMSMDAAVSVVCAIAADETIDDTRRAGLTSSLDHHSIAMAKELAWHDFDRAGLFDLLAKASPEIVDSPEFDLDFQAIRNVRRVNSNYRINNVVVSMLDGTIAKLWLSGNRGLALRMITTGHELGEYSISGDYGALDHYLRGHDDARQALSAEIDSRRTQSIESLREALDNADAKHVHENQSRQINSIIAFAERSQDPEAAVKILTTWASRTDVDEILSALRLLGINESNGNSSELLDHLIDLTVTEHGGHFSSEFISHPLLVFLKPGGLLRPISEKITRDILGADDKLAYCNRIYASFTRAEPLWKSLVRLTSNLVDVEFDNLGNTGQNYEVDFIAYPRLEDGADATNYTFDDVLSYERIPLEQLTVEAKRALANDQLSGLTDEQVMGLKSINIREINPQTISDLFAFQLQSTVEMSRSPDYKRLADIRNRQSVANGLPAVNPGDYLHATSFESLPSMLQDGNFAGEARGASSSSDVRPYNVDFSVVGDAVEIQERIEDTASFRTYGKFGEKGDNGQIILAYRRGEQSWMRGHETIPPDTSQALIFGGIPSSEISAVILTDPNTTLATCRRNIVENGFYIPIFDNRGNLLFSPSDYDHQFEDLNMQVEIPAENILNNSIKINEKLGSTEGGLYLIPTPGGPKRHYVKFPDDSEQVWTEWGADQFYAEIGVAVPDSRVVLVEGRLGRASLWLDADSELPDWEFTTLEDGAAMDMLLANWDVVYNSQNVLEIGAVVIRPDSGSAMDIWATGGSKREGTWGSNVGELNIGTNKSELWRGMRQEYPNLTEDKLRSQVTLISSRITDSFIDRVVDSMRRPREARESLKATLKARRDFMVAQVLGHPQSVSGPQHTPPDGPNRPRMRTPLRGLRGILGWN